MDLMIALRGVECRGGGTRVASGAIGGRLTVSAESLTGNSPMVIIATLVTDPGGGTQPPTVHPG